MKICVIGNSHAAQLLRAHISMPSTVGPAWDFFVAPNGYRNGLGLRAIEFDDTRNRFLQFPHFIAESRADLSIEEYNTFVLVGAHLSAAHIAALLESPMSSAFRSVAIEAVCRKSYLFRFMEKIRVNSTARIALVVKPPFLPRRRDPPSDISQADTAIRNFWRRFDVEYIGYPADLLDKSGLARIDCMKSLDDEHLTPDAARTLLQTIRLSISRVQK